MRTVGDVLAEHGAQYPRDILRLLPSDLSREASHHAERLNLGTLNKKLDMRTTWNRYVEAKRGDWPLEGPHRGLTVSFTLR